MYVVLGGMEHHLAVFARFPFRVKESVGAILELCLRARPHLSIVNSPPLKGHGAGDGRRSALLTFSLSISVPVPHSPLPPQLGPRHPATWYQFRPPSFILFFSNPVRLRGQELCRTAWALGRLDLGDVLGAGSMVDPGVVGGEGDAEDEISATGGGGEMPVLMDKALGECTKWLDIFTPQVYISHSLTKRTSSLGDGINSRS